MSENKVEGMMGVTMDKIRDMIDVNTIIGNPITTNDGATIVPVSKVTYGFASGGSDFPNKKSEQKDLFGGGSGAGITISPVAFLVINKDDVKLLQIESFNGAIDRIIALTPDIVNKITSAIKKRKEKKFESKQESN